MQTPPAGGDLSCQVHIPCLIQIVLTLLHVQAGRALRVAQVLAYSLNISLVTGLRIEGPSVLWVEHMWLCLAH